MPSAIPTAAKSLKKMFALVSPFFILLSIYPALIPSATAAPSAPTATVKRQAAAQFQRAEQLRTTLNLKPVTKRTLGDYRQVVSSYRRVYLITPRANEVPEALIAIAQLYTEMGERFGRNYYQNAADSYRFLLREYPSSHHVPDAMLVCAKLQRDQLADYAGATQTYKDFLKRFPRSPRKREAQEGVAELALLENSSKPSPDKEKDKATSDAATVEAVLPKDESSDALPPSPTTSHSVGIPRLRRIRSAVTEDATRVTIDLEDVVHYNSGRLENPERIFFDLREARLTSEVAREVAHENANVDGDILTAIRVAQNHAGVVRIVLNVNRVKEYVASVSPNPPQLLIDLYRKQPPPAILKIARASHNSSNIHETTELRGPEVGTIEPDGMSDTLVRPSQPTALKVSKSTSKPDLDQPAIAPQPTHDGQSTLTRALGLKIGRIVIDAGHGGHDTGTIGPTGLMEKDLCLDVALRLSKIISVYPARKLS
jgi:N-acetylmuramoyl-L-alanine amidase